MKDEEKTIIAKIHYKEDGKNVSDILDKSLWIFIKKEIDKLCSSKS